MFMIVKLYQQINKKTTTNQQEDYNKSTRRLQQINKKTTTLR